MQVEEGCVLNSADDIAGAVHHILGIIEEEANLGSLCGQDSSSSCCLVGGGGGLPPPPRTCWSNSAATLEIIIIIIIINLSSFRL